MKQRQRRQISDISGASKRGVVEKQSESQVWPLERVADLARKYGFERVSTDGEGWGGFTWRLACSVCDAHADFPHRPTVNVTEVLLPAARGQGWETGKDHLIRCPDCVGGKKAMRHIKFANKFHYATQDEAIAKLQCYGVRPGMLNGVSCWECECDCGALDHAQTEYNPDLRTFVDTAIKRFVRMHWTLAFNKPPRCPACARKAAGEERRERWDERVIEAEPIAPPLALPAPPVQQAPVIEASVSTIGSAPQKMMVAVCVLLAQHFDKDAGLYRPDWDDARVAAESGAQTAFVISIRREHYAELAEPPEVTEFRRKIEAMEAKQDEDARLLAELKAQLAKLPAGRRKPMTMLEEAAALARTPAFIKQMTEAMKKED